MRHFKAMTLHKKAPLASLLLGPEINPISYLLLDSRNRLHLLRIFIFWEDFCGLGSLQRSSIALSCVSQVGFQKRTRQLFGSHTQLELVLAGLILVLAALLLGCLVALWVQYHRGRWVHTRWQLL